MRHERMNAAWILNLCPPSEKKKEWQTNLLLLAWLQSFQNQVLLEWNNCISPTYKHTNNLHACAHTHTRTGPDEWSPDGSCRQRSDCCPLGWRWKLQGRVHQMLISLHPVFYTIAHVCVHALMCTICKTWRHRVTFDLYQRVVNISTISFSGGVKLPF